MKKFNKLVCPVCKSKEYKKFWAMSGYRLARCNRCGMVWDFFPPNNLVTQYTKTYFINENPKGGYSNYFEGMGVNKRTFSSRLKRIAKKYGKGKLLDVGCALGDCLIEAKKLGWKDAEGLELSDYAYKFAKKRGLKVKKGVLKDSGYPKETFDVVTYQDVIEHVTDP
ncbi:MAG: methyltransferase domain-containing protein, partial [Patescibacteria group bacterium]